MTATRIAYIGLGANEGKPALQVQEAIERIKEQMTVLAVASFYETKPIGGISEQPWYINTVVRVQTMSSAGSLLRTLLAIEQAMGRVRRGRWDKRVIDCDLLLYDNQCIVDAEMTVPHARMMERAFVLIPLIEIMPLAERAWQPGFEQCIIPKQEVNRWNGINWN